MSDRATSCARGIGLLVVLLLMLGGCGTDRAVTPVGATFHPDQARWRMPLDDYLADPGKVQYARDLVYGQCLRADGFTPPPVQDPGTFIPPTFNRNVRSLFNVQIARVYGYHRGNPPGGVVHERPAASKEEQAARSRCARRASEAVGGAEADAASVYAMKSAAYETAIKAPAFLAAAQRWRTCMLPLGLPDLPAKFEDGLMPTDSQRVRFKMTSRHAVDVPGGGTMPSTVAEVKEAVLDARCRETSGLTSTQYRLESAAQLRLMSRARDRLGRIYRANQDAAASIDALIKRYAG